jgi:chromosome partitioning protein
MIITLLNQRHGVGKTTLALHLAGVWACQSQRVAVIDADPQGCALECSDMRAQERLPRRFTVIALARNTLHRDAPNIAREVDRVIVDGPSHIAALTRSVLLIADLVLVPLGLPPSSVRRSPRRCGSSTRRIPFGRSSVLGLFSTAATCV